MDVLLWVWGSLERLNDCMAKDLRHSRVNSGEAGVSAGPPA